MIKSVEELKEQRINEIAKDLCSRYSMCTCVDRDGHCSTPQQHARIIYGLGYKKQVEGKWIKAACSEKDGDATCSVCGHWDWSECNYCSNCGAKMKKED